MTNLKPTYTSTFGLARVLGRGVVRILNDAREANRQFRALNAANRNVARREQAVVALARAVEQAEADHATALGEAETIQVAAIATDNSVVDRVSAITAVTDTY